MQTVKVSGNILFDPKEFTNKHQKQSDWKKVALIEIGGDIANYYSWFLSKKGLTLNQPLRGAHVTFINDRFAKIVGNTDEERQELWNQTSAMFNKTSVEFTLDINPYSNIEHWWLRVSQNSRSEIQAIRNILGLGEYFYGFHMTIGIANEKNKIQSRYLKTLCDTKFI